MEQLNQIFQTCIIPLLGLLTVYIILYLRKKSEEIQDNVDNALADKYIAMLTETIIACIRATNQTYVDALKDKNAFDEAAQIEAFNRTKEAVLKLLNEEVYNYLNEFYGDINILIDTLIESNISIAKGY